MVSLVLFKPKTSAESKGQVFVAVTGYGLEGVIPDAIANRDIVDHEMIPRFKQGDIYGGLYNGAKGHNVALASGEFTPQQYHEKASGGKGGLGVMIFLFILFFVIIPIFRGRRKRYYTGGSSLPFLAIDGGHDGLWR